MAANGATEFVRELFSHGKVTIPHELRELYGLKDGDLVRLTIVEVIRSKGRKASSAPRFPHSNSRSKKAL